MAGTIDFEEATIECPFCGQNITITIVIDYDPKYQLNPLHRGISGGGARCSECGRYIRDKDLE